MSLAFDMRGCGGNRTPDGGGSPADTERVWKALANRTRREILDLLRTGPKTTGWLDARLTALSRYAVMQHLDVLVDARLVLVRREGRYRYNYLNAVPLRDLYERWVVRWADDAARDTLAIERLAEPAASPEEVRHMIPDDRDAFRVVRIESEIRFRAPAERVFDVIVNRTREWFPSTYGGDRTVAVVTEPRPGGAVYEDWGDGAGYQYGHVTLWDPPHALSMRTRLFPGTTMDSGFRIAVEGEESMLSMSRVVAGPMSEEEAESIGEHGDLERFEEALRRIIEGERTPPSATDGAS